MLEQAVSYRKPKMEEKALEIQVAGPRKGKTPAW